MNSLFTCFRKFVDTTETTWTLTPGVKFKTNISITIVGRKQADACTWNCRIRHKLHRNVHTARIIRLAVRSTSAKSQPWPNWKYAADDLVISLNILVTLLRPGCLRRSRPDNRLPAVPSPEPHSPIRSRSISYVHFPALAVCDCLAVPIASLVLSRWAGGAGLIADSLLGKQENFSAITQIWTTLRLLPLDKRWR